MATVGERYPGLVVLLLLLAVHVVCIGAYDPQSTSAEGGVTAAYFLEDSAMYFVRMAVGTPPQLQTMVLDTGIDVSFLVEKSTCPPAGDTVPGPSLQCFDTEASDSLRTTSSHSSLPREYCRISADYFQFQGLNGTATDFIFCLSTYDSSTYAEWQWDGVLGMNYLSTDEFEPVTEIWPRQWPDVYSLDFNGLRGPSWLYLGGADSLSGLEWSETTVTRSPRNVEFTFFQAGICGQDLRHESTNILLAAVATDTPCLALPEDLYKQVMGWIDGECEEDDDEAPGSFHCNFPPGTEDAMQSLPSFRFRLSQDGEDLFIPLEVLASQEISLKDGTVRVALCVDNMKEIYNSNTYTVFGSRVLEALYMVVDMRIRRVAFRQKDIRSAPERCPAMADCRGDQTYDGATNSCLDPPCSQYFALTVDSETMTCKTNVWMFLGVVVLIAIFAVVETSLGIAHVRSARIAAANAHQA